MKFIKFIFLFASVLVHSQIGDNNQKIAISETLDKWHSAAAKADFELYFSFMTADAVFIGTDATENWQNQAFRSFSKPFFDKGKAWNFKVLQRNIYLSANKKMAWFDELLDTQMKICRGSGVLVKHNGKWMIAHYVLSITIPNDKSNEIVKIKTINDDELIKIIK